MNRFLEKKSNAFKNLINFRFDTSEKEDIVYISSYSNMKYTSVILKGSEAFFLREEVDATFRPILYCVLIIYCVV